MGYTLQAIIGPEDLLRAGARGRKHAYVHPLAQGFALIPITEEFYDEFGPAEAAFPDTELFLVSERIAAWCAELSRPGAADGQGGAAPASPDPVDGEPISDPEIAQIVAGAEAWLAENPRGPSLAAVAADFFGGTGTQSAVVWRGGKVVPGSLVTNRSAINDALSTLGVQRGLRGLAGADLFEILGLGRHRSTDEWALAAGAPPPAPDDSDE